MENQKLVNQARSANESRHMMKAFQGRHSDLNEGEDVRNPQPLIKAKEKKLLQKRSNLSKDERQSTKRAPSAHDKFLRGKQVSNTTRDKIIAGMRPTRSKVITKNQGRDRDDRGDHFKSRGGRGGGRGGGGRGGRSGSSRGAKGRGGR